MRQAALGLGVSPDRAHTIYQGIDPHVFQLRDRNQAKAKLNLPVDKKIVLWVGRMVPIKGLGDLVTAFKDLLNHQPNVQLCLMGDGPSRKETETLVRSSGLAKSVTFAGSVGHDGIADWYTVADLFVMSSLSEGLPNVLREALACGTPFVCTNVGSVREIADERYSRLVPANSPQALTKAILTMFNPKFQQAAAEYQARTWKHCAVEMAALLRSEIERRQCGRHSQRNAAAKPEVCLSQS